MLFVDNGVVDLGAECSFVRLGLDRTRTLVVNEDITEAKQFSFVVQTCMQLSVLAFEFSVTWSLVR
jgi:hypothetical protein